MCRERWCESGENYDYGVSVPCAARHEPSNDIAKLKPKAFPALSPFSKNSRDGAADRGCQSVLKISPGKNQIRVEPLVTRRCYPRLVSNQK